MDGTGAGTSTGRSAGSTDVTGSAGDVAAGAARPVGRADATGPLPVPPADPTGPLPTPPVSWFAASPAETTAAQPAVDTAPTAPTSPSSWFATGPLPVVPASSATSDTASWPEVAGPATPPAGAGVAPPAVPASAPPASLFEPAGSAPATGLPPATAGPHADPPPPTGLFPAVGPQPSGTTAAGSQADAPPPTGLFEAIGPPATGPRPAGVHDVPPPVTGHLPATGGPPAAAPTGGFPAVSAPVDSPVQPADATGPMPAVGVTDAPALPAPAPFDAGLFDAAPVTAAPGNAPPFEADPGGTPPATIGDQTGPWSPPQPHAEAPPRTGAWAFAPDPAGPPRTDSWSFVPDNRRSEDAQSGPLPTPGQQTHTTGTTTPPASIPPARKPAKRPAWPLTLVGVVVAVAAGIALVFSLARADPADLATTAAAEAGSWPGIHYEGTIAALDGGVIQLDLTVTADGASGTLSRDGGRATAELLRDSSGTLLRANREWWLYHHPTRADDLADSWVADPLTETREIAAVLQLSPAALAEHVRGEQPAQWEAIEQQLVDDRSGVVLFDGARRVVVGSDDPHPLLAVDVAPGASTAPVQVNRSADEEVAGVVGAAARVRQEAAPRTLTQLLLERPKVEIQLQPEPLCTAQTCNVTVTVTNSGTAPARGRLEISADGKIVANHPLDVHPGQVATFTAAAPNPQFAQPGATGQILWESRAVDD